jgi:SAM-dependent methyltransferase
LVRLLVAYREAVAVGRLKQRLASSLAARELARRLPVSVRNTLKSWVLRRPAPRWGNLHRLEPFSQIYGFDRGLPVDRKYVDEFVVAHRADVRGVVLEVQTTEFTQRVGGARVEESAVLDIRPDNPHATLVADLCEPESLPEGAYDCFILTQTLHLLPDVRVALANAWRSLAPGGVLLLTVPVVSRVDPVELDLWRFTPAGLERLLRDELPEATIEVRGYGNLLAALATLLGVAVQELDARKLELHDRFFPIIVGARVEKRG